MIKHVFNKTKTTHAHYVLCLQAQLTSIMDVMAREAIRKMCRVFQELYKSLTKENKTLKDKVVHLEAELKSEVKKNDVAEKSATQTVYKIKHSGQFKFPASQKNR